MALLTRDGPRSCRACAVIMTPFTGLLPAFSRPSVTYTSVWGRVDFFTTRISLIRALVV